MMMNADHSLKVWQYLNVGYFIQGALVEKAANYVYSDPLDCALPMSSAKAREFMARDLSDEE
jgi:hypothetical protein